MTQILNRISQIADDYEAYIIDIFGVVLSGEEIYPGVIQALEKLSEKGKTVALVANTAERSSSVKNRLENIGLSPCLFQFVFTSGEELFNRLNDHNDPWYVKLGSKCYFIGPSSLRLMDDLPQQKTDTIEDADFIVVAGSDDWHQKLSDYEEVLIRAAQRQIPMVCANPNLTEQSMGCELEAGTIVRYFEELGGTVKCHGKPNADFYLRIQKTLGTKRVLMIGDSMTNDIVGAGKVGIDGAFVACGLHLNDLCAPETAMPDMAKVRAFYHHYGVEPKYTLPGLVWFGMPKMEIADS